jgi:hypothetical protein
LPIEAGLEIPDPKQVSLGNPIGINICSSLSLYYGDTTRVTDMVVEATEEAEEATDEVALEGLEATHQSLWK